MSSDKDKHTFSLTVCSHILFPHTLRTCIIHDSAEPFPFLKKGSKETALSAYEVFLTFCQT